MRRWLTWVAVWLASAVLYLLYAAKLDADELIAAAVAGVLASLATAVFARLGLVHVRPSAADLMQAWRIPGYVVTGTIEVLHGLLQQLFTRTGAPSALRAVRFEAVGDDAHSAARRALALTYTTLTPNFLVLGIVAEQRLLLYHQIQPGEVLLMTRNLGARP